MLHLPVQCEKGVSMEVMLTNLWLSLLNKLEKKKKEAHIHRLTGGSDTNRNINLPTCDLASGKSMRSTWDDGIKKTN